LVTVKDVLRHEAAAEHAHKNRELYAGATEGRDGMWSIEDNAAGLEVVLEEALSRTKAFADGVTSIVNRVFTFLHIFWEFACVRFVNDS
jgi:hypothetical protein